MYRSVSRGKVSNIFLVVVKINSSPEMSTLLATIGLAAFSGLLMASDLKCAYCNCTAGDCLVQCPSTGLYFCNGKGATSQSHIIHYLRSAQLDRISLPEVNAFHAIPMRCYICESENIFRLGFVTAADGSIFIVCRSPCQFDPSLLACGVKNSEFIPVVSNNEINPMLVRTPKPGEFEKIPISRAIDVINSALSLSKDKVEDGNEKLVPAKIRYDSVEEYCRTMETYVDAEMEVSMGQECHRRFNGIQLEWLSEMSVTFKCQPQLFKLTSLGSTVKFMGHGIEESGRVSRRMNNLTLTVMFPARSQLHGRTTGVVVIPIVSDIPFVREKAALAAIDSGNPPLHWLILDLFLGCTEKMAHHNRVKKQKLVLVEPNVDGFPKLNEWQVKAAKVALSQRFTLIQGPPGTGKTTVIAALAHAFVKNGVKPVLVCAQSNVAADFATVRVAQTGVSVVRVLSTAREAVASDIDVFTTRHKAIEKFGEKFVEEIDSQDQKVRWAAVDKERQIIANSDVVCATCVSSGGARLKNIDFPVVIFDESGQCLDPDLLIGLTHNAQQAILVGDHRQLGPIVVSRAAAKARYDMPLMQRLVLLGVKPAVLRTQYRMHPAISVFPSRVFYHNFLNDGVSANDRKWATPVIPWPNPEVPVLFWNVASKEEYYDSALSYVNRVEATCIGDVINAMAKNGIKASDIGIITPYAGQQTYLVESLPMICSIDKSWFEDLEVASVDGFQGREKNFIIFSCVRANTSNEIGFLKDMRRLCVSLTRAKYGFICLGNADTFARNKLWVGFITHCISTGVFVEGDSLDGLKPSTFTSLLPEGQSLEIDEFEFAEADTEDDQIL